MISNEPHNSVPHREPFLWITRLISRSEDGKSGVVELDIDPELDIFRGHFPGRPVFPGVLQIEAAAQACLWILIGPQPKGSKLAEVLFAAVDSYKFKKPVVPPATLSMEAKQVQVRSVLQLWEVAVKCQGQLASAGSFWFRFILPD